jgi:hypothetical protein
MPLTALDRCPLRMKWLSLVAESYALVEDARSLRDQRGRFLPTSHPSRPSKLTLPLYFCPVARTRRMISKVSIIL